MLNININKLEIKTHKKRLVNVSFNINDSTALIGESGSGKSLTLKALLNLLPSNLSVEKDINSNFELNYNSIGFIPQNPFTSLSSMTKINPFRSVRTRDNKELHKKPRPISSR